jgi:hypothetical protein
MALLPWALSAPRGSGKQVIQCLPWLFVIAHCARSVMNDIFQVCLAVRVKCWGGRDFADPTGFDERERIALSHLMTGRVVLLMSLCTGALCHIHGGATIHLADASPYPLARCFGCWASAHVHMRYLHGCMHQVSETMYETFAETHSE